MCKQVRGECEALYIPEAGKTCPTEILEALAEINAEGRPIWKPMHAQPIYRSHAFITREGDGRAKTNAYIAGGALGKALVCIAVPLREVPASATMNHRNVPLAVGNYATCGLDRNKKRTKMGENLFEILGYYLDAIGNLEYLQ